MNGRREKVKWFQGLAEIFQSSHLHLDQISLLHAWCYSLIFCLSTVLMREYTISAFFLWISLSNIPVPAPLGFIKKIDVFFFFITKTCWGGGCLPVVWCYSQFYFYLIVWELIMFLSKLKKVILISLYIAKFICFQMQLLNILQ